VTASVAHGLKSSDIWFVLCPGGIRNAPHWTLAPRRFRDGDAAVGAKPDAGMGQFGRIRSLEDLPSAARIASYVRKAIERIDQKTS
jgi:hypothetical protein